MRVSNEDWSRYIRQLSAVNRKAAEVMQSWMDEHPNAEGEDLVAAAYAVSEYYGDAAGSLACSMYDALAEAQGAAVPPAEPAPNATYDETAKAVYGTLKNKQNTVPATVGRLVKQTGADTMLQNAQRDRAQFAWIPMGDTCAFCLTLGSRGWQNQSKKAMKNGHAEHIHANCDCQYAVRFDGRSTVEGYDPEALKAQYDSFDGTPQEKINAWRREKYAADPEKYREQKRIAYAKMQDNIYKDAKGVIIEGDYHPEDIRKAVLQESTNFVIKDINHPDSLYGELCENILPIKGYYDIKAHGSPSRVKIFNSPVDAKELARIITLRSDYGNEPIRLLCCETGQLVNGTCIAKELSQLLGVDVMAPTEVLRAYSSRRQPDIISADGKEGWMRLFHPDGNYDDIKSS